MPDRSKTQFDELRRATGLLQEDLAYLLGYQKTSSVSRLQNGERMPDLRTAFACEIALGASASAVFSSVFCTVLEIMRARAHERLDALTRHANDLRYSARLTHLSKLAQKPATLFDA